jgi:hypothetical protein
MTIGTNNRMDYVGTGAVDTYSFNFKVFAATDLRVTVRDTDGVETDLAYPADFSVSGVGAAAGGSITLLDGDLEEDHALTIRRVRPISQTTDIRNQSAVFNDVLEDTLDHLAMIDQQQQDDLNRALKLPETESEIGALPTLETRIGKFLAFDPSGNPIPSSGTGADSGLRADLAAQSGAGLIGFRQGIAGAVTRDLRGKLFEIVTSTDVGIVHDDATDNTDIIQALVDAMSARGGGTILWAPGIARVSEEIVMRDDVWIIGMDETSGIRNVNASGVSNNESPLRLGYWHPSFNGVRPIGSPNPYTREIDRYLANAVVTEGSMSVTLATAADAGNFVVGEIAYLRSQEAYSQTSTGVDIEIPLQNTLVRILSANAGTGVVTFENPAGFDSATAPYLCRIQDGAGDSYGDVYFVQRVRVERMKMIGRVAMGNNNPGMYDCHFRDITGDVTHIVQANGFVRSSLDGFRGTFNQRLVEAKFCAHDSYVKNIIAAAPDAAAEGVGMISIGEYCRNITVSDFLVLAPLWGTTSGHVLQLQPGKDCRILNGKVFANGSVNAAVNFYGDLNVALDNIVVDGVEIHTASRVCVQFSDSTYGPKNCNVRRSKFFSSYSGGLTKLAVAFNNGQGNVVEDCWFEQGAVDFAGASANGNRVQDSIFPDTPSGAYLAQNQVVGCRAIAADGEITEHRERFLTANANIDPGAVAAGAVSSTSTVSVPGAVMGDHVRATYSVDLQGLILHAWVSAADTVSYRFVNPSGAAGPVDLAGGQLRVRVMKI